MAFSIAAAWDKGHLTLDNDLSATVPPFPARPEAVRMVHPSQVKSKTKKQMLHALVHAESYAIDLSWDIIARYGWSPETWATDLPSAREQPSVAGSGAEEGAARMPRAFFDDWVRVGMEEAKHMSKWKLRLEQLGGHYGEYNGHDSLWESAVATAASLPARLAIVHCVHEARGLDVYTGMLDRLSAGQDTVSVAILKANHVDEITHVEAGRVWLENTCARAGVDPKEAFQFLVRKHFHGALRPPFNEVSRTKAGLLPEWYEPLAVKVPAGTRVEITAEDMG